MSQSAGYLLCRPISPTNNYTYSTGSVHIRSMYHSPGKRTLSRKRKLCLQQLLPWCHSVRMFSSSSVREIVCRRYKNGDGAFVNATCLLILFPFPPLCFWSNLFLVIRQDSSIVREFRHKCVDSNAETIRDLRSFSTKTLFCPSRPNVRLSDLAVNVGVFRGKS